MATSVPADQPNERPALRDEQSNLTRQRILDAVVRILATDFAELSVEAVARESGVSRPTVYRYFHSKREMVEAVGQLYAERIGVDVAVEAADLDELLGLVPDIFARYDALEPELQAAARHAETRAVTARRRGERLRISRGVVDRELGDVPVEDRQRIAELLTVLLSSAALQAMQTNLELSSREAGELVVWAIRRLIADVRDRGSREGIR
jgi:AcrR family transcriptional regulator